MTAELTADLRRYCRLLVAMSLLVPIVAFFMGWLLEDRWWADSSILHRFLVLAGAGYAAVVINAVVRLVCLGPEERDLLRRYILRRF